MFPLFRFVSPAGLLLCAALAAGAAQAQGASSAAGSDARAANFQAGYGDGCATAQSSRIAPKKHRDEAAYQASESYRSGWKQGYDTCRQQMSGAETPERLLGDPFARRW